MIHLGYVTHAFEQFTTSAIFVNTHREMQIAQCVGQVFTVNICSSSETETRKSRKIFTKNVKEKCKRIQQEWETMKDMRKDARERKNNKVQIFLPGFQTRNLKVLVIEDQRYTTLWMIHVVLGWISMSGHLRLGPARIASRAKYRKKIIENAFRISLDITTKLQASQTKKIVEIN